MTFQRVNVHIFPTAVHEYMTSPMRQWFNFAAQTKNPYKTLEVDLKELKYIKYTGYIK